MTKENAHEYLPFVQALAEGKEIEVFDCSGKWASIENLNFNAIPERYRIKPEKKLVPFTWEDRDLLRGKWCIKHNDIVNGKTKEYAITCITDIEVYFGASKYSYSDFMRYFTFLDGSPCGKEVEE